MLTNKQAERIAWDDVSCCITTSGMSPLNVKRGLAALRRYGRLREAMGEIAGSSPPSTERYLAQIKLDTIKAELEALAD